MSTTQVSDRDRFRIGTVSRLTGLSVHTLRKWETRYGAVAPQRGQRGQRYYSQGDVERLLLIKRLVEAGAAPRDVGGLLISELEQKAAQLEATQSVAEKSRAGPAKAIVVGSGLAALLDPSRTTSEGIDIVAGGDSAAALRHVGADRADVLLYECPIIQPDTPGTVEALRTRVNANAAVVVYEFGTRDDVQALLSDRITAVRGPVDIHTIETAVAHVRGGRSVPPTRRHAPEPEIGKDKQIPAPRLSRKVVARVTQAAPTIQCECPRHLAEILLSLLAFEEYSESCESRNPEDAALHRYLWRSAAQARALFEDAIERVAEAENISLGR